MGKSEKSAVLRCRSTKAGASTPATPGQSMDRYRVPDSLNEGRSVNPGYTWGCSRYGVTRSALNEGRSVNPGYTDSRARPRHLQPPRSTKAGASTPATRIAAHGPDTCNHPAQRRPERQPRLHNSAATLSRLRLTALNEGRSVNPGYTRHRSKACQRTLAQRRPERQPRLHARAVIVASRRKGSTKAGASTPATHSISIRPLNSDPLNEGRSVNPGYTFCLIIIQHPRLARSTKAGASTPATRRSHGYHAPTWEPLVPLNEGRSVNPGYTRPGASVPAFYAQRRPDVNPGYTRSRIAQRRPERQPRLHTW